MWLIGNYKTTIYEETFNTRRACPVCCVDAMGTVAPRTFCKESKG